jgi:hypothetical protein
VKSFEEKKKYPCTTTFRDFLKRFRSRNSRDIQKTARFMRNPKIQTEKKRVFKTLKSTKSKVTKTLRKDLCTPHQKQSKKGCQASQPSPIGKISLCNSRVTVFFSRWLVPVLSRGTQVRRYLSFGENFRLYNTTTSNYFRTKKHHNPFSSKLRKAGWNVTAHL